MNICIKQRAPVPRTLLATTMLFAVLTFTACDKDKSTAAASASATTPTVSIGKRKASAEAGAVTIRNFAFQPATLTVAVGTKVVWTNRDDDPHRVVSDDGAFTASPALDTDDSYSSLFTKAGTYGYYCSIHPHMVGKIVVK